MSLWCLLVVWHQEHGAASGNLDLDGLQRLSQAGAKNANTGADIELRAMRMADDAGAVAIEVGIFAPCHWRSTLMRAGIAVGMKRLASPHHEDSVPADTARVKATRMAIDQLMQLA